MSNCKCGCGCGKDDVYSFVRKQLESGKSLEDVMKELTEAANRVEKEKSYQEEFLKKYGVNAVEAAKYYVGYQIKKHNMKCNKDEIERFVSGIASSVEDTFDTTNSVVAIVKKLLDM